MVNSENCPDHECMQKKIEHLANNKKFWHRILESKWFFWATTGVILLWLTFNGWVVQEIQTQKEGSTKERTITETISKDVKEIKENNKDRDRQREQDQREIIKMLMDIQKQIKK